MVALILILDQNGGDEQDLLMKAEALREFGRFDDAMKVLDRMTNVRLVNTVEQIRRLILKRDLVVRIKV